MKKIIIAAAALTFATAANAQQVNENNASATAQQAVQLALSNALELTFTSNGLNAGEAVTLPFINSNDYQDGVESTAQQLKIRSNKPFNVTVKTSAENFSVTAGGSTTTSTMPASTLGIVVTDNNTGGNLGTGFSTATYKALSASAASLITSAHRGGNQNFTVKYKATPGFAYPAGVYSNDVVYTATQE